MFSMIFDKCQSYLKIEKGFAFLKDEFRSLQFWGVKFQTPPTRLLAPYKQI